jgi:hypothetical protein
MTVISLHGPTAFDFSVVWQLQTFFQSSFLDHHLVVQGKWQFLIQKMF